VILTILFAIILVGSLAALVYLFGKRSKPRYLAVTEYWVYLPGTKLPKQDEIMGLVLKGGPVGPKEGLLFSDVRLHVALALKTRNAQVFRPDLFDESIEPTAEHLAALAEAESFVKIRYLSEERLKDNRHLMLLPYLAYAYAKLGGGRVVYDVQAERLMSIEEMKALLKADPNAARPEFHTRIVWHRTAEGAIGETRGLLKVGMPELTTVEIEPDEQLLVTNVLEEAIKELWIEPDLPERVEVVAFEDAFRVSFRKLKEGRAEATILRMQPVL
jgi:hypothetical protein